MKNILFLGDYFPNFSYASLGNHSITKKLNDEGFNIFYISASWCDIDQYSFVNKCDTRDYSQIKELYFVDPIQSEYSNLNMSLAALSRDVINNNQIDTIFISDAQKYGITAELIGRQFELPISMGFYNDDSFFYLYEQYTKLWFDGALETISNLYTYKCRKYMYQKYCLGDISLNSVFPYEYSGMYLNMKSNCIVILGCPSEKSTISRLRERIIDISSGTNIKLLLWGTLKDLIYDSIKKDNFNNVEYLFFEDGPDVFNRLGGMIAVDIDVFISSGTLVYDRGIYINKILLILSYGMYPLVANNSVTYDAILANYNANFEQFNKTMSVLLNISDEDIGQFKL